MTTSLKQERIAILGAYGQLGKALRCEFEDCTIKAYGKVECDLTQYAHIVRLIDTKPTIIINAAAVTHVDWCETPEGKALADQVNGVAVGLLAHACYEHGITLVHYSTDYVFDGSLKSREKYREDAVPRPINAYGISKHKGEVLLQAQHDKYYLLRTGWLYGGGLCDFVERIMLKLGQDPQSPGYQELIRVVDDRIGTPNSTHHLAAMTRYILENKLAYGIYHPVAEGTTSWYRFAREIAHHHPSKNAERICTIESAEIDPPQQAVRPYATPLANTKLPKAPYWHRLLQQYMAQAYPTAPLSQ